MPKGKPATGRARQKSYSVWIRPFIKEVINKKMSVEEGLKFLDAKAKQFHKEWR
jgi:hypothetical protein